MGIRLKPDGAIGYLEQNLIWGSMGYGWTSRKFVHQSFYIENDGVETVVHAVMDETASVIRFGLVDKDTGFLQLAAVWKLVDGRFIVGDLTDKMPNLPYPRTTEFSPRFSPLINTDQRHMVYQSGSLGGSHQRVINFQTGAGRFPDQMPFIVGLTTDGYFGITLGSGPPKTIPVKNFTAPINEVQVTSLRSRLRNYRGQVGPIIFNETVELSGIEIFGVVMGAIFGIPLLLYLVKKFDKWLEKIRLDDEKRAVDKEAYELIARLRHANDRKRNNVVCGIQLQDAADSVLHTLMDDICDLKDMPPGRPISFTASWPSRMRQEYGITYRRLRGEVASVDTLANTGRMDIIREISSGFELDDIYNCDETDKYLKEPSTLSYTIEELASGAKPERGTGIQVSILFCVNASGSLLA
ncbi:hypothetical protein BGZ89_004733 [Linnemannia elongata]|nr:hypothetical protein BGZ89_004733 [Linnemannia elongata]